MLSTQWLIDYWQYIYWQWNIAPPQNIYQQQIIWRTNIASKVGNLCQYLNAWTNSLKYSVSSFYLLESYCMFPETAKDGQWSKFIGLCVVLFMKQQDRTKPLICHSSAPTPPLPPYLYFLLQQGKKGTLKTNITDGYMTDHNGEESTLTKSVLKSMCKGKEFQW